jgi:hypothetical protein
MIWILLLYVLPLVLCTVGVYWMVKKNEGTIKDFLEPLPFCFIPIMNIAALVAGVLFTIEEFLQKDESWQNFKNKKL